MSVDELAIGEIEILCNVIEDELVRLDGLGREFENDARVLRRVHDRLLERLRLELRSVYGRGHDLEEDGRPQEIDNG